MFELIANFHFLRPWWLLGWIAIAILWWIQRFRRRNSGNWEQLIHPSLLPYLMEGTTKNTRRWQSLSAIIWSLAWVIACIALAGPAWQKLPQPIHKTDSAFIIILDLSPSMLAEDIQPSRLIRARYKLIDILNQRKEGYAALVVYSGSAHLVSPLTEDTNTIVSLVPSLAPALMPSYGTVSYTHLRAHET